MVFVIRWILHKAGRESTISGYLVFLLMGPGDQAAIAMNSQSHAPSHFSVFENALTCMQFLSEHLQGDFSIVDSSFALFAFGGTSECCAIFELYLNDGIERERVETMVDLL